MTTILVYSAVAVLVVVLTAALALTRQKEGSDGTDLRDQDFARDLWEGRGLSLAETLFNSSDYLWLRDEIGHPQLARVLARSRKRLALEWLRALRRSFDDLVRTPEAAPRAGGMAEAWSPWRLLLLTTRFHFLLTYALLVVRFFGPYHRLIPSWKWVQVLSDYSARKTRYAAAKAGDGF